MTRPLSSWSDSSVRQAILDYISSVTTPGGPDFVCPDERIATFDNDGTLWCEKPAPIQLYFAIQRLKTLSASDPALLAQPPYRAAAADDFAYFSNLYPDGAQELMELLFDTHAGMTQDDFEAQAQAFLAEAVHPQLDMHFKQLTYQPMVELLHFLMAHDFRVFIVTAGGMSFVRTVSEEIYGIARERVIGSNISFETRMTDRGPLLYRAAGLLDPLSDGPGKPVNIELHVGRKPILAAGNANGDLHMLWYCETSRHRSLQLLLHHDDAEREYAYDLGAENVQQLAAERGWTVISMKRDFAQVFAKGSRQ